jgi:UDP-N-acetylmuramyl pentapeptide phosphotransferase/UDP-N-acetylglucosamine-1-phosphate transferase
LLDLGRYVVGTALGGYAVFLAIVVIFYFVLGEESGTLVDQALGEGSVLAFAMVVPVLLLLGWIEDRLSVRRSRRAAQEATGGGPDTEAPSERGP